MREGVREPAARLTWIWAHPRYPQCHWFIEGAQVAQNSCLIACFPQIGIFLWLKIQAPAFLSSTVNPLSLSLSLIPSLSPSPIASLIPPLFLSLPPLGSTLSLFLCVVSHFLSFPAVRSKVHIIGLDNYWLWSVHCHIFCLPIMTNMMQQDDMREKNPCCRNVSQWRSGNCCLYKWEASASL